MRTVKLLCLPLAALLLHGNASFAKGPETSSSTRSAADFTCRWAWGWKNTHPASSTEAYDCTSYSVLLQSLNAEYIDQMLDIASGKVPASSEEIIAALFGIPTYCMATSLFEGAPYNPSYVTSYENTAFDKKTGWSRFLKRLTVNPSIFLSDSRDTARMN